MLKSHQNRTGGGAVTAQDKPVEPNHRDIEMPARGARLTLGDRQLVALLQRGGPGGGIPASGVDFDAYRTATATRFTQLAGTEVQVQPKALSVDDTKASIRDVERSPKACDLDKLCDPEVIEKIKYLTGRILKNGYYYPYVTAAGDSEGLGRRAYLSVNGAQYKGINVPGGKPELANELHALEKNGKVLLGYRAIDLSKGWFAIYYSQPGKDAAGKDITVYKMGQFYIKDMPSGNPATPLYWAKLAEKIHPALPAITKYYFSKP